MFKFSFCRHIRFVAGGFNNSLSRAHPDAVLSFELAPVLRQPLVTPRVLGAPQSLHSTASSSRLLPVPRIISRSQPVHSIISNSRKIQPSLQRSQSRPVVVVRPMNQSARYLAKRFKSSSSQKDLEENE